MKISPYKMMIPGPVEVDADVLDAMGSPVQPHYGPEWKEFYGQTINILKQVFNTKGDVFLMVGSGTAGLDACMGSGFSTGDKILVGINGFFGDRLLSIAESYGLQAIPVRAEWGKPLTAAQFEMAYQQNPDACGAAIVHLETSTTILNPIQEIGPVIRRHGGIFMVDAVSSLGGVPFSMDDWCIDLCASATQKCLGAAPGLAPVAVGPRGWEAIDKNPKKAHGWYGDLSVWRWYAANWGDWHPSPVTMATNNVAGLNVSLNQLMTEGIPTRLERYRSFAMRLRSGLRAIGLQPFTPDELMTPVLTAVYCPPDIKSGEIITYLANEYKIKISPGLGEMKEKIFRIGHMSPVLQEKDIDFVLEALGKFMQSHGL